MIIEIEDAKGVSHPYRVIEHPCPSWYLGMWEVAGDGSSYTVIWVVRDQWRCNCPDYQHRHRHHETNYHCKHILAMKERKPMETATKNPTEVVTPSQRNCIPAINSSPQTVLQSMPSPSVPTINAPLAHIAQALATAQQQCRAAAKDRTNRYANYDYASAEAIIAEAKAALAGTGLAVVSDAPKLRIQGTGNMAVYTMVRSFMLMHVSGEEMNLGQIEWPVSPDAKQRPLEKAYAIAITSSLGYFLRDLLLMPRVDQSDELAGTPPPSQPQRTQPEPEQRAPEPESPPQRQAEPEPYKTVDIHQLKRIYRLLNNLKMSVPEALEKVQRKYPNLKEFDQMTEEQANEIELALTNKYEGRS
jgi:hypothetical protein